MSASIACGIIYIFDDRTTCLRLSILHHNILHCFRLFALFRIICTVSDYLQCFRLLFALFQIRLTADQSICTASLHTAAQAKQNCGTDRQAPSGFSTSEPCSSKNPISLPPLKNCDCTSSPLEKLPLTFPQCVVPRIESLVACQKGD